MKTLHIARLTLRAAQENDAAFLSELMNDRGDLTQIGDRGVRSPQDALRSLRTAPLYAYGPDGLGFNVVETRGDSERVGICGLVQREGLEDVDLGYALLDRRGGKGYATEAAATTLQHAREELGLARVVAITTLTNQGFTPGPRKDRRAAGKDLPAA